MATGGEKVLDDSDVGTIGDSMGGEEEEIAIGISSGIDHEFDTVVGHIEDVIIDHQFQELLSAFMEKYYSHFEEKDENKLIYTDIFQEYTNLIEKYIENELISRISNFSMENFLRQLESRTELEGEVFEMLHTFGDFVAFKEMFVDYKKFKENTTMNISDLLVTSSINPS